MSTPPPVVRLARELSRRLADEVMPRLPRPQSLHAFDPLDYAWAAHRDYLDKYATGEANVLLLGMNPGPWGMAQTGVPFGEVNAARDWLGIEGKVKHPGKALPRWQVHGWECPRAEVSGQRLWGMLQERYRTPGRLKRAVVVMNYCPLLLMSTSGGGCRNFPVDKLAGPVAKRLRDLCDEHLAGVLEALGIKLAIGVGGWAERRLREVAPASVAVAGMLHPSPASPLANRGFAQQAQATLDELDVARAVA